MDLVSIIIPVYNVEAYLDRCIASAVGQTYSNIEIILVDDGSTDRCPEICDRWAQKDARITVIHQANSGLSSARNIGIAHATGKFIILLDSDDFIASFAVERMLNAAHATLSDMVICSFIKGADPNFQFSNSKYQTEEVISNIEAIRRIYDNSFNALMYTAACFKMYKRHLFKDITYPAGKIFEDIYTTHKILFASNKIAILQVPLFYYFQRPGSIMNTSFHIGKLDYLQALVERVEFFSEHHLEELESIAYDELLHSLIWEYSRTRDVLHSREGMEYVTKLFRQVYRKGYSSKRYPQENRWFLSAFFRNPEWIILYWRVKGKLNRLKPKK